ncbi:hypothetical protein Daus18300_011553 [Diaporthe australafricana]|uniref:Cyanovirin-N domain-containing protein n=1 Tax=Diaporthe australafricana TaxID=127596 RepID=A0ABR3W655_9PEZI
MLASRAVAVLVAVIAHHAAAKFTSSCSWWYIHDQVTLTAGCDASSPSNIRVTSSLDLNRCIGVDPTANAMIWQVNGDAFDIHCGKCGMQNSETVMECDCISAATGKTTISSVNLGKYYRFLKSAPVAWSREDAPLTHLYLLPRRSDLYQ